MTKSSRAGGRISLTASGDNQLRSGKGFLAGLDMEEVVNLADGNRLRTCADVHAVFQHLHLQALDNGLGAVGAWKDTAVVLHFELDPIFLKEIHDIVVVKLGEDAV